MVNNFTENDVIPIKFAIKFEPPVIALEYHLKPLNNNYLLQINLEQCMTDFDDPNDICSWIFETYSDVVTRKNISERQVLNLIQRILIMKRMHGKKEKEKIADLAAATGIPNSQSRSQHMFEPDLARKETETEFYKSNQNFYKQDEKHSEEKTKLSLNEKKIETEFSLNNLSMKKAKNNALDERNKNYLNEDIKKDIDHSNNTITLTHLNEINNTNHSEFPAEDLSNYFSNNVKRNLSDRESYNYTDEISVESLNSD